MSDEQQTTEPQETEVQREERRLERLRLVTQLSTLPEPYDDESGPQAA
jgi:hypothetical protein